MGTADYLNYHKHGTGFLWSVLIYLAIIFTFFPHNKYAFYAHSLLGGLIIFFTLALMFPLIIPQGFQMLFGEKGVQAVIKAWFGLVFIILCIGLIYTGLVSRIKQQSQKSSTISLLRHKKIHRIVGVFTIILCKVAVLIGYWRVHRDFFLTILIWEIVSIVVFCFIKKKLFKTLQQTVQQRQKNYKQQNIKKVKPQQLEKECYKIGCSKYIIFQNYVYDVSRLQTLHPGGYQIIKEMLKREIDRFILGLYSAQNFPGVPKYSHSRDSLKLIGPPLFKLDIPSPYQKISTLFQVSIMEKRVLNNQNNIFMIRLQSTSQSDIIDFKGYSNLSQLGQYFLLTIEGITRLYTSVNFLDFKNLVLMKSILEDPHLKQYMPKDQNIKQQTFSKSFEYALQNLKEIIQNQDNKQGLQNINSVSKQVMSEQILNQPKGSIPLMIKKYSDGKFTSKFFQGENGDKYGGQIKISFPMGLGLDLSRVKNGKILIVCGGTGIYPFLDLIDLLFKQHLIQIQHPLSNEIKKQNPIFNDNESPFQGKQFTLLAALKSSKDIPSLSLFQIDALSKNPINFKAIFKISQKKNMRDIYTNILFQDKRFTQPKKSNQQQQDTVSPIIREQQILLLRQANCCETIWICGSPEMNTQTYQCLVTNKISKQKIHFI